MNKYYIWLCDTNRLSLFGCSETPLNLVLIPSRFVFIQFRRFGISTPSSSRESRVVGGDSRRDHRAVDDGRSGRRERATSQIKQYYYGSVEVGGASLRLGGGEV